MSVSQNMMPQSADASENAPVETSVSTTSQVIDQALRCADVFHDISDDLMNEIAEIATEHAYDEGETIYSFGQFDGSEFFVVLSGRLDVSQNDPSSGEMLIDHYAEGDVFALAEAMVDEARRASLSDPAGLTLLAATDMRVAAIDAFAFCELVEKRPALTRRLMTYFAAKLARRHQRTASDAAPQRRVYASLLKLVRRDAASGIWRIDQMPKHRELAQLAGAEEPVAANAIAQIIQDKIARRDYPGLVIDDMAALNRLAE